METKQELINEISDRFIEIANLYNEVDTSDLQGIAEAAAKQLLQDLGMLFNFSINDVEKRE